MTKKRITYVKIEDHKEDGSIQVANLELEGADIWIGCNRGSGLEFGLRDPKDDKEFYIDFHGSGRGTMSVASD